MLEAFHEKLSELRRARGASQREIAKLIGVTPASLSAYEKGDKTPSLDVAVKIAQEYGVSLDWLCSTGESPTMTGDDFFRCITQICETFPLAEIETRRIPYHEYGLDEIEYAEYSAEEVATGVTPMLGEVSIRIRSEYLYRFAEPYEKYRNLYLSGDLDNEMFTMWKNKRFEEAKKCRIHTFEEVRQIKERKAGNKNSEPVT